ncbi:NAD-dependent epimerase/dehydratase family protein [Actinomycetospora sp. TBRC 11914]|uniref:NAD-dependent epimerase/dehydratase family protein n=1 Tax=Actinomycetospora sp. TBRC 11914 TaxID=2729387 RepID=UPI0037BEBB01
MEIVLTGATGFVGSAVLARLEADPAVTHVSALGRRHAATGSPETESIVLDDLTAYPDELLARLAGHAGCIWTLGGKDSDVADPALYTRITHDFTLAFAAATAARVGDYTFCYLSGAGADPTETARLPWQRTTTAPSRGSPRARGEAENAHDGTGDALPDLPGGSRTGAGCPGSSRRRSERSRPALSAGRRAPRAWSARRGGARTAGGRPPLRGRRAR